VLALDAIPDSVAVVGAGYIGVELGTALARLGCRVTLLEALDQLLPSIDQNLTAPVLNRLRELGVEVQLGAHVIGLDGDALAVETPRGEQRLQVSKVVVATGRTPNTDELGLELAGIAARPDGLIPVTDEMRATEQVCAVGDVVGGPALAHKAISQALVAAESLCGLPAAFDPAAIPAVIFSDPEIATVGLSEAEARAAGFDTEVTTFPHSGSGRAATIGDQVGFTRVVVNTSTDCIIGIHLVGPHVSELIGEGTLAIEMAAAPADLAATIHPHPTLSESLATAAAVADRRRGISR
jgi:dihydrolipoamide dehydrogenase